MNESSAEGGSGLMSWQNRAACQGMPTRLFYADDGERGSSLWERQGEAKAVCRRCPVQPDCLQWAYDLNDRFAVLGGTTGAERHGREIEDLDGEQPDGRDETVIELLVSGANLPHAAPIDVAHAIVRLYHVHQAGVMELARRFNVSSGLVRRRIRRYNEGKPLIDPLYMRKAAS